MSKIKYSRIPVKMIMENNIVSDIVYDTEKLKENLNIIRRKILELTNLIDFFIVVLNKDDNKIKGIITSNKIEEILKNRKNSKSKFVDFIENPKILNYKDSIVEALTIFETGKDNIILIEDKEHNYMGKLKRTTLKERFTELRDYLES